MTERQSPEHPSPEALAALAEKSTVGPPEQEQMLHLARCRRCLAVYAEFVEAQVDHAARRNTPPAHWIKHGLGIAGSPTRSSRPRRWIWIGAAGVAAASAVLAIVFLTRSPTPGASAQANDALTALLRTDSQGSLLYGDDLAPEPRGVRGGNLPEEATGLEHLLEQYRSQPSDPEVAYWLVSGYLATNQIRNGDAFLGEALKRFPEDVRFLNLSAILAYKKNSPREAEIQLRKAAAMVRAPAVLVNLAILRRQAGDENEAQALLKEVLSRFPNSEIAPYVRELAASGR